MDIKSSMFHLNNYISGPINDNITIATNLSQIDTMETREASDSDGSDGYSQN